MKNFTLNFKRGSTSTTKTIISSRYEVSTSLTDHKAEVERELHHTTLYMNKT